MEEIFKLVDRIRNWEMEAGESFLDYFDSSFNEVNYLFWCLGKGYITKEQFHAWEDIGGLISSSDIVFGDEEYSVIKEPEYSYETRDEWEKIYRKAMTILAEFLLSTKTYQKRVEEFFEENPI